MNTNQILYFLVFILFSCVPKSDSAPLPLATHDSNKQIVPVGGNSWVNNGAKITKQGLENWNTTSQVCKTYFSTSQIGTLKVSLFLNTGNSTSKIKVTLLGKSIEITAEGDGEKEYFVGEWAIEKAGYVSVDVQGIGKTSKTFGLLTNIGISGSAIAPDIAFTQNNTDNYFYWGRRGPSVHLRYNIQNISEITWFYNEVTVPENNDVIGSYFMANGFGEGYFGMQVNSETERRILFSIWSPYKTDNPNSIPDDYKIVLLKKGDNVYSGEFGNEGAGGQSYLKYPWKAGKTYKFLIQGKPIDENFTVYTAYFFAPEDNKWLLIASFKRPKTSTYLKGLYSFLENFDPENGDKTREALYGNQWVMDSQGKWTELTNITFTGDATARKNYRKDYAGGEKNNYFFLKNCGFFSDFTRLDKTFSRLPTQKKPVIDFLKLP